MSYHPPEAREFSSAFIQRCSDAGIRVSHLKLQKLMYYCQGYHLALHDEPIFNAAIHAWEHGPVVSSVYGKYSPYKGNFIDVPTEQDYVRSLQDKAIQVIDFVIKKLGRMGAWELVNKTHREDPWRAHYNEEHNHADQGEITASQMKSFFRTQLAEIQDRQLASIMDSVDDELVSIPSHVKDKDQFYQWIQSL